jgi:TatD DNase family protein
MTHVLLPALDLHAHVETDIAPAELTALDSVVFAVTRYPVEWPRALSREDDLTVWGVGCHPGAKEAITSFTAEAFAQTLPRTTFIGEVGLDGRARASSDDQESVFQAVLELVSADPRPISVHSFAATARVLDLIEGYQQPGIVLHWWRGSEKETVRALELGCWFSLNGAEARSPKALSHLPADRVLTETDFPHSGGSDRAAARPGAVRTIERALGEMWHLDEWAVRRQIWQNFRRLLEDTNQLLRMPRGIRRALLLVGR